LNARGVGGFLERRDEIAFIKIFTIFASEITNMQNNDPEEWFPVIDAEGNTIGKALRSICHDGKSMLLHPVVHLHLFNTRGELFLQKRSETKDIQPGKWDTSVGGHVGLGESVEVALAREVREELGLKSFVPHFLKKYIWQSTREREMINSYSTISDENPVINKSEIDEGRFWTRDEIIKNLGKEIFTPNFEHEYKILFAIPGE
jgi:isopentenyldiphosphate isomerase